MNDSDLKIFDISVVRYLSHQMSEEEELAFKEKLANSNELKRRAAIIAMTIKAMQEVVAERDERIIGNLEKIAKIDFCKVTKIKSY